MSDKQVRGMPADLEAEYNKRRQQLLPGVGAEQPAPPTVVVNPSADKGPPEASLAALEAEPAPAAERKKLGKHNKNRTATWAVPYVRDDDRETIKTGFNLDVQVRRDLDLFFAMLGPRKRNLWAEAVLAGAMRRTLRRWDRSGRLARYPLAGMFREILARPEPVAAEVVEGEAAGEAIEGDKQASSA